MAMVGSAPYMWANNYGAKYFGGLDTIHGENSESMVHQSPYPSAKYYGGLDTIITWGASGMVNVGKAAAQDNGLSERRILTGLLLLKSSRS